MKKLFFFFLLPFLLGSPAIAQVWEGPQAESQLPGAQKIRQKAHRLLPHYVQFQAGREIPQDQFAVYLREAFSLQNTGYTFAFWESFQDQLGHTHTRYQQLYQGVPVEGSMLISHAQNGRVYAFNGDVFEVNGVSTQAAVNEQAALQRALDQVNAKSYMWEDPQERAIIFGAGQLRSLQQAGRQRYFPKGELVIMAKDGEVEKEDFRLSWKFDIYAREPHSRRWAFVDAQNGDILCEYDRIHTADSTGVAITRYSGQQSIVADSYNGGFRLREAGRAQGVVTLNLQRSTDFGQAVDFTDSDNYWNNFNAFRDDAATDAHWGAEMTHDYFLQKHNRNSYDGSGSQLRSYVHFGIAVPNAFWNGQAMIYGDGAPNTAIPQPATVLDICGHEFAHGVTNTSARLIYRNESGALNESFSDIFGKAIEHFARPNDFTWVVGEDMGTGIRNMEIPNDFNNPDTYQGRYWFTGSGDNGGVHYNSGVQNKWFQLLVEGGSGTNDLFDPYSVQGLGWDSAGAIAYRNLAVYLTPNSDYSDARFYAIQSAIDLYGNCSKAQESVMRAWYAVGVGTNFSVIPQSDFSKERELFCSLPYEVPFQDNSSGASAYVWYFGDGDSSLAVNPTHTYANPGQYTVTLKVDGVCGGTATEVKQNFVEIQPAPQAPSVSGKTVFCRTATQLIAQSTDEVAWFDASGNLVGQGDTLPVPPLSQTTTYYARSQRSNPGQYLGPVDNTFANGGFLRTDGRHLTFDVHQPAVLESVKVYADGGGERIIEYRASDGSLIQSKKVFIPNGESRVSLGFLLRPGREQQLGTNGVTSLYGNIANPQFPYDLPGLVSITGTNSSTSNFYVLFYDWEVAQPPCEGPLVPVTVNVNAAPAPEIADQQRCGPGPLTLSGQSGDSLLWYNQSGQLVGTGSSLYLPMQTQTDSFRVERIFVPAARKLGPADGSIGSGNYHNVFQDEHLSFSVLQPVKLKSVWVDARVSGARDIQLSDGNGNVIRSDNFNLPAGASRISLDWDLLPGNYRLGGTNLDLYRSSGGVNYPYEIPGLVSINNSSSGPAFYYYFYDWELEEESCTSASATVVARVAPGPSASFSYTQTASTFQFQEDATGSQPSSWSWDFGDGNTSNQANPDHTYTAAGTYVVSLRTSDGNCQNVATDTVVVDQVTSLDTEMLQAFQLFPNPGNGELEVNWQGEKGEALQLRVLDAMGRRVWQGKSQFGNSLQTQIDLSGRPNGTYLIQLKRGTRMLSKKYILMR